MKSSWQFVILLASAAVQAALIDSACKPIPGDSNWPSDSVWTEELPGAVKSPPQQGNTTRPDFVFTAKGPADVQAAIRFVGKHNVRLSIINSGHDFLGRNDAPNGLWLVVGNLKGVRVAESYTATASGVPAVNYTADPVNTVNVIKPIAGKQAFVTFGAGVGTQDLNDALHKSGLFTIGAASSQVKTAGGYGQTSGHGPFSSKYGLAADNLVEFKVVTADGTLRVANSVVEKDLFWALRGGGGGTFGVVVEATMQAQVTPRITMTKFWFETIGPNDTEGIFAPAAYMHSQFPALNAHGVQGYYFIYPTKIFGEFLTADEESGIERSKQLWGPILASMEKYPGIKKAITQYTNYANYKAWFDHVFGPQEPSDPSAPTDLEGAYPQGVAPMDSRLLSDSHLTSPKLRAALQETLPKLPKGQLRGHLVGGGKVLERREDTSVHPAWRNSLVHLIATGSGGFPNATALKRLAPETGCYANECSFRETSFKATMWGGNYDRLYLIKTQVDPKGIFWATPGIGADDFKIVNGRLCRAQSNGTANDLGAAPANDNRNYKQTTGSGYKTFPESQEAADKEATKPFGQ